MKEENPAPPKFPLRLLQWFCRPEYHADIEGDLIELFSLRVNKQGLKTARWHFWWDVILLFRPAIIRSIEISFQPNQLSMLKHTLLLAYRSFRRYKSTFFINLIGLSTGLACTLLIYLWVSDELSFDKFHEKNARLFQVMLNADFSDDIATFENTPGILAETLAKEIPEVEHAVTAQPESSGKKTLSYEEAHLKADVLYASKDYFKIFSYDLLLGDEKQVLTDKSAIVISKAMALKLFNTTNDVMGKTVEFEHDRQFYVSGVFETIPHNSSSRFDCVIPFEVILEQHPHFYSWGNFNAYTYLVLKEGATVEQFNHKIADVIERKSGNDVLTLFTRPYSQKYLFDSYESGVQVGGRITYVRLFSIIAIFILVIACINFMNLSTAKASQRLKEVGIKKVVGADRKALIYQYLGESMIMTLISLFTATLLVRLLLPQFNEITGKQLTLDLNSQVIFSILGLTLLTGLISGSYPALYLSGLKPVVVLKGRLHNAAGEIWARRGLVVFQFTLSVMLIVAVLIVYKQVEFVQNKNLGYNKDHLIYFNREGKVEQHMDAFFDEVKKIPGILKVSSMIENFLGDEESTPAVEWEGKDPDNVTNFFYRAVDYELIEMLGMEMATGRSFSKDYGSEDSKVIFNEAAINVMGMEDPIGKVIRLWNQYDLEIIGVVKDFHFQSLHEPVRPTLLFLYPEFTNNIVVKLEAAREMETIGRLQQFYQEFNPGFPFEWKFLDEDYQAQHLSEQRVESLSKYFAGIAIVISCLGLFGLAAFTAERRLKEISIRKILGSSEFGIIRLLSKDFTRMVLIAVTIAIPISYVVAKKWLDGFAYSIDLEWWFFAGSGSVALLIAWLIVGIQTIKAVKANPAKCLKND